MKDKIMNNYFRRAIKSLSIESLKKFIPYIKKYENSNEYIIYYFYMAVTQYIVFLYFFINIKLTMNYITAYSTIRFIFLLFFGLVNSYFAFKSQRKARLLVQSLSLEDLQLNKKFQFKRRFLIFFVVMFSIFLFRIDSVFAPFYEKLLPGVWESIKKSTSPKKQKFDVKKQVFYYQINKTENNYT